jgi:hypothetical protein
MGAGDVGADAYGNTTRLSTSEQQYYINLALAKGASRADIDQFIANNGVNDLGRIVSALGLNTGNVPIAVSPGATVGTTSYSAGVQSAPPEVPYVASVAAPQLGETAALTRSATADDGRLTGSGGGGSGPSGPTGSVNVDVQAPAAAPAFPPWIWIAAAVAIVGLVLIRTK